VIPFVVPRKSELFQEDLYPDTLADVPALTADDWWSGTNADPILVPMSEQGVEVKKAEDLVVQKKSNATNQLVITSQAHLQPPAVVAAVMEPDPILTSKSSQWWSWRRCTNK